MYAGFDDWYRQNHPRVLTALVLMTGSTELAVDATDEAFVRALDRWDQVRAMESAVGWTIRVGLNVAKRRARRRTVELTLLGRERVDRALPAPAGEAWDAVRQLPERQRTAVVLRYALDLPEAEIASVLGTSRSSVSTTLTEARRRLATLLADQEVRHV
jgi:RNA polymerase sigma-70 factor, ECF subfamily